MIHSQQQTRPISEPLTNDPWFTAHAARLSASLALPDAPSRPLLVGVFQNQPLSVILDAVASAGLDLVQLHGTEPAELAKHIPVPVIRVFHVGADGQGLDDITRPGLNEFVLLDAAAPGSANGLSGGTGTKVDWELAKRVVDAGEVRIGASAAQSPATDGAVANGVGETSGYPLPVILAGGLTPENVRGAVEAVRPFAVDVSGGVESEGGTGKDAEKVRAFVHAAKGL